MQDGGYSFGGEPSAEVRWRSHSRIRDALVIRGEKLRRQTEADKTSGTAAGALAACLGEKLAAIAESNMGVMTARMSGTRAPDCAAITANSFISSPRLPARKGGLNQAAFSLALFIRDACRGDLVGWIDSRLAAAGPGTGVAGRAAAMRAAIIEPLTNIVGTGRKVWSMILAELLLGGDPARERWTTAGASLVAIDSLVHAYLHRTGILRRLDAGHLYGSRCYASGGRNVHAEIVHRAEALTDMPSGTQRMPFRIGPDGEITIASDRTFGHRSLRDQEFPGVVFPSCLPR